MHQQTNISGSRSSTTTMEEDIDFRALCYSLLANKWLIVITMAACFALTAGYLITKAPQYSSNVLLQVETNNNSIAGIGVAGLTLNDRTASAAEIQTVLIKSRYILEPVVQNLGLDLTIRKHYFPLMGAWYAHHHTELLAKPLWGLSSYAWGGEQLHISQFNVPIDKENSDFHLVGGKAFGTYNLYDDNDQWLLSGQAGKLATKGAYTLMVDEFIANAGEQFSVYKKNIQPIAADLAKQIKIDDLAANGHTGVLQMSLDGPNPPYLIQVLNAIATQAVEKNTEKKSIEATKTLGFLNQQLPLVKQGINNAESALNQYRAKTGKIDLDMQTKFLLAQITDTQKLLEETQLAKLDALQKDTSEHPLIIALNDKEKLLTSELATLQLKLSKLPVSDQKAVNLLRDVKVKSQLYLLLLNKLQSLQVTKAGTVSDIRILALANYPESPLPTKNNLILLGSLLIGFILSAGFIILKNSLHRKIIDPNALEQQFGLINMAIVPYSEQQKILSSYDKKKVTIPLLAKTKPKDLSIEALRSFRTSLQFAMMDAKNNIITIMGIAPSVGKSFISSNFAYLLADAGKKILLIDGDIRRGHLKDYFSISAKQGFSEVLSDQCTFEQAVVKSSDHLDFLSAGAYPPNPSELLMNERLTLFLAKVSPLYDLVIIDTAPILAVTDAAVIGHHAGANFMVIAANKHEQDEVNLALKRLNTNGIRLNGSIFNFSLLEKGLYRYGYSYGYGYGYQAKYE